MRSKVVFRCRDGRVIKGYTLDFTPNKSLFHVTDPANPRLVTPVMDKELKAVFYVKTFAGNPAQGGAGDFTLESMHNIPGMKLRVVFEDNEVMFGTTMGYNPGRPGFWISPADTRSNNTRVYVFAHATTSVDAWRTLADLGIDADNYQLPTHA